MEVQYILCLLLAASPAAFAGRAFPVDAEYIVTDLFSRSNPRIEWDPTNLLVDLSGRYALCKYIGRSGSMYVEEKTDRGMPIYGLSASYDGEATDSESVTKYIKRDMPNWLKDRSFDDQIKRADKFGCSIQPNCKGRFIIACLFSYRDYEPTTVSTMIPHPPEPTVLAYAFTPAQYDLTEYITGKKWDRSHLLENLSGKETHCSMIYGGQWSFTKVKDYARERGMDIEPVYGSTTNSGGSDRAITEILQSLKPVFAKFKFSKIGCSLMPGCNIGRSSYTVISCLLSI